MNGREMRGEARTGAVVGHVYRSAICIPSYLGTNTRQQTGYLAQL